MACFLIYYSTTVILRMGLVGMIYGWINPEFLYDSISTGILHT